MCFDLLFGLFNPLSLLWCFLKLESPESTAQVLICRYHFAHCHSRQLGSPETRNCRLNFAGRLSPDEPTIVRGETTPRIAADMSERFLYPRSNQQNFSFPQLGSLQGTFSKK